MKLKLYLERKYFEQLSEEGKSLYNRQEDSLSVEFPAVIEDGLTLADCVPAFIESVYLEMNPKYALGGKNVSVSSELYKLGQTDEVFNLLVTMQYEDEKEPKHEILIFQQEELTDDTFSFSLVGDQTFFQLETY